MKLFNRKKPGRILAVALDPNPNTPPAEFATWRAEAEEHLTGCAFDWAGLNPFDWQLAFWAGCDPETAAEAYCTYYAQEYTRVNDRRQARA